MKVHPVTLHGRMHRQLHGLRCCGPVMEWFMCLFTTISNSNVGRDGGGKQEEEEEEEEEGGTTAHPAIACAHHVQLQEQQQQQQLQSTAEWSLLCVS